MLYNYLIITLRKSWNNKTNAFTKLISLAIGIVSLFYISLYVYKELSYDNFHSKRESIYRLNTTIVTSTGDIVLGLSSSPEGEYLKSVAPEIIDYARISKEYGSHAIRQDKNLFSESENIYYADPTFFRLFDFNLLQGNKETALAGPDKIILSEKMAKKYFGSTDALDKTLLYDGEAFLVTGVMEDIPANSQLQFEFLVSMETFMKTRPTANENWSWFPMNTYLLLNSPESVASVNEKLSRIPQYLPENSPNETYVVSMEPLDGIHFSPAKLGEPGDKGSMANIYILSTIGIMILFLAVSNYINLTVAYASLQGKEVSVKKTLGASGRQIFNQFFVDSIVLSVLATTISVGIIVLTVSNVENFIGHAFDLQVLLKPEGLTIIVAFPLVLALLSGVYPSFRFSTVSPIVVQKADKTSRKSSFSLRTGLLMFQFAITSAFIIGSLIIYNQLSFIQNKDLGMNTEQMLVIDYGPNGEIGRSFQSLKAEFSNVPGVNSVAFSSHIPGEIPNGVSTKLVDKEGQVRNGDINLTLIDYDFVKDYGLQIIAGRSFSAEQFTADNATALIMNEAAVTAYGYTNPEEIIGVSFEQWGGNGTVVGVVKDFNYLSLHQDVGLLSLKIWPSQFQKISIKIAPGQIDQSLKALQKKWEAMYPEIPFNYYFVDDSFNKQYKQDQQFADIIAVFTIVSSAIGTFGLIAFATFWCERRKKEISIRKVLGADTVLLIWKFYKEFSIPVLISFIVGIPIAFYFGSQWLQQFAYKIDMSWTLLVLPVVILTVIIGLSVGYQSLKVVLTNPVNNLKEE